jgi:hypothetical protein
MGYVNLDFSWPLRRPARGCKHISDAQVRSWLTFQAIDYSKTETQKVGTNPKHEGECPAFDSIVRSQTEHKQERGWLLTSAKGSHAMNG